MPQSIAMQSMPVSHNTSGYNLNFNPHDVSQPTHAIKPHRYQQSFDEEAYKSSGTESMALMNKIIDRPTVKKSETKSPSKVMKKTVSTDKHIKAKASVDAGKSKKELKKPPIPTASSPKKSPKKSVKKEEGAERGERRTRKGIEESNNKIFF